MLIPVNAANKRKIKGVVHADSGSGKTVFIEPEAVAAASSRLRELENDERREVARILIEFTNLVRPHLTILWAKWTLSVPRLHLPCVSMALSRSLKMNNRWNGYRLCIRC